MLFAEARKGYPSWLVVLMSLLVVGLVAELAFAASQSDRFAYAAAVAVIGACLVLAAASVQGHVRVDGSHLQLTVSIAGLSLRGRIVNVTDIHRVGPATLSHSVVSSWRLPPLTGFVLSRQIIRPGHAVEVVLKNGDRILIDSGRPDELVGALRRVLK
jgi:hypothetical protein